MRLYICIDGSFAGTQAEANAKGKGWTQVEVPTDKPGLIAYLNGMVDEARYAAADEAEVVPTGSDTPPPAAPAPDPAFEAAKSRSRTASEIVDFILDDATVGQVENVMSALGTRFAELAKARRG